MAEQIRSTQQVGSKGLSAGESRTSELRQQETAIWDRFTSLSEVEKASVSDTFKLFDENIVSELSKVADQLRPGEGKLFVKTVLRYKSIVQPVSSASEGIRIPLDAVHESGNQISIWIPENLEAHADSAILAEVLRYVAHVPGVKLQRTLGSLPDSEQGNWFVMGYITELLSNQVIKQIRHSKDSPYSLGRACARVKLLMASISPSKIPSSFLQIPDRFLGGISQFKESELTRALKTYFTATDASHIERLLQILSTHLVKVDKEGVRSKIDVNLFLPPESVVNKAKRHVTITERTAKGRPKVVHQTVTPTKPSQLATVAIWERIPISEMYEHPWEEERNLIEKFKESHHLDRDYVGFRKQLSGVFERQWGCKQSILRATSHRVAGYPGDRNDPLYKKLNWIRDTLRQFSSLESLPKDILPDFNPMTILPRSLIASKEGPAIPFTQLLIGPEGKDRFPSTCQILDAWDRVQSSQPAVSNPAEE